MSNALTEGVGPVGDLDMEGLLDLALVEHGIGGTLHGTGELIAVAGLDVATSCE